MDSNNAPKRVMSGGTQISRRTVTRGVAWSAPIAAIGVAAPAFAASGSGPTIVVGDACKLPGASCNEVFVKGYVFEVSICNNTAKPLYLYDQAGFEITIQENSPQIDLFFQAAVDQSTGDVIEFPFLMASGACITIVLNAGENGNSTNVKDLAGTISVPWGHTPTPPDPDNHPNVIAPFSSPDTPPQQGAQCQVQIPTGCGL